MNRLRRLLLALLCAAPAVAQTPEQMMTEANQLYQRGDFAGARGKYEALRSQGYGGVELLYNLGNTCYKTGDLAHAVLSYERALRLAPDDDDLRYNLQMVNLLLTDRIEPTPRLFLWDYWDGINSWFSLDGVTLIGACAYAALMACLAAVFLARSYRTRRLWFASAGLTGLLVLFTLVVFVVKVRDLGRNDEGIVMSSITSVKNAPDSKSSDAFVLHMGVKVRVIDRVDAWVKIRLADGKVGWMEQAALEII